MNEFSNEERRSLLLIARNAIAKKLGEGLSPGIAKLTDAKFFTPRGVFVTLEIESALRGCIGNILPAYPLIRAIEKNAVHAAFDDPRFAPITNTEFDRLTIEISVLSIPKPLEFHSPDDLLKKIKPGEDGVVLRKGAFSATFLPQVWEDLAGPFTFFEHLSLKAGLDKDSWKDSEIETYRVEKWNEDHT